MYMYMHAQKASPFIVTYCHMYHALRVITIPVSLYLGFTFDVLWTPKTVTSLLIPA